MFHRFKTAKVVTLGAVLSVSTAGLALASVQQTFEIVNLNKSASVVQAWFAPAGTTEPWKAITIYTPVGPGSASQIDVSGSRTCRFDIKVRFNDGYEELFANVDLCTVQYVVLN